jgi:hypothetical protein
VWCLKRLCKLFEVYVSREDPLRKEDLVCEDPLRKEDLLREDPRLEEDPRRDDPSIVEISTKISFEVNDNFESRLELANLLVLSSRTKDNCTLPESIKLKTIIINCSQSS